MGKGDKYWTIHVGPLRGKRVCEACYTELAPDLEKLLVCARCNRNFAEGEKFYTPNAGPLKDKPLCEACVTKVEQESLSAGVVPQDEATMRKAIGQCVAQAISLTKDPKLARIGFALTDDRTMWDITLLVRIGSYLQAIAVL
jgi:hypothetical protein